MLSIYVEKEIIDSFSPEDLDFIDTIYVKACAEAGLAETDVAGRKAVAIALMLASRDSRPDETRLLATAREALRATPVEERLKRTG